MFLTTLYIILGIALLYKGSEWAVRSVQRLSRSLRIARITLALTVVAIGTTLPEFMASLAAVMSHAPAVALGNVIGSNLANLGLILGLAIAIKPIRVELKELLRDGPWLILGSVLILTMAIDLRFSRFDGIILLLFAVIFYSSIIRQLRGPKVREMELPWQYDRRNQVLDLTKQVSRLLLGFIALIIGAKLLISGAVIVAGLLNIPELVIGLTLVALGTSLPELAVSTWAASHRETDFTLGNVIGANIANIFIILGLVALIAPMTIPQSALNFDIPFLVFFTFLVLYFIKTHERLDRQEGLLMLIIYFGYIIGRFIVS